MRYISGRYPHRMAANQFTCPICGQAIKPGSKAMFGIEWDSKTPTPHMTAFFHKQCAALDLKNKRSYKDTRISDEQVVEFWCDLSTRKANNSALDENDRYCWSMFPRILRDFVSGL